MSSLFSPCNQDGVAASINTVLPSNRGAFISASAFVQFAHHVWWNGLCFLNCAQSGAMTALQSNWLRLPGAETPLCSKHLLQPHNYQSVMSLKEAQRKVNAGKLRRQRMPIKNITQPCTERSERAISKVSPFCPWTRSAPLEQMRLVPAVARPSSGFSLDEILSSTASASKTLGVQHLMSSEWQFHCCLCSSIKIDVLFSLFDTFERKYWQMPLLSLLSVPRLR